MPEPRRRALMLIGIVVAGVIALALMGRRLSVTSGSQLTGCIADPGTGGGLGLARWADKLGYNVRGLDVPVWEAAQSLSNRAGNCVITMGDGEWSPLREPLSAEAWLALKRWLSQGNTLIVVTALPGRLPEPLRDEVFSTVARNQPELPEQLRLWTPSVEADPETVQIPTLGLGNLSVSSHARRWGKPPPHLASEKPGLPPRASDWQWSGDSTGGVLYRVPFDKGALYLLLDNFAWSNAGLDHGENAQVLAGIFSREVHGGALAIDEYRHGHGRAESFLTFLSALPGSGAFFWIAVAWGLLYFYGRNVRWQPLAAYEHVERRTAREFIDAVAQLYERARAAPLTVEAVALRFRHLLRGAATPESQADNLRAARPASSAACG